MFIQDGWMNDKNNEAHVNKLTLVLQGKENERHNTEHISNMDVLKLQSDYFQQLFKINQ